MQTPIGTFYIEDIFNITGRGLVLVGSVHGEVGTGQSVLLHNDDRWIIKGISWINNANREEKYGLLIDAPVTSR